MTIRRHVVLFLMLCVLAVPVFANHSWGGYHWARTSNPFTLKLYDNVDPIWESYLSTAVSDWNKSTILDYAVQWQQPLTTDRKCGSAAGVVEICNLKYGQNGWLGIAGINVSGLHITKGYTKLNDTYFAMSHYNTPGWRQMVTCQEIAHDFGLDHQDENFNNTNLGTCMDYTNDPTGTAGTNGTLSNEHPNQHDYDEIGIIYQHLDNTTTIAGAINLWAQSYLRPQSIDEMTTDTTDSFGTPVRFDKSGRPSVFAKPLGMNDDGELEMEITHIIWADEVDGSARHTN